MIDELDGNQRAPAVDDGGDAAGVRAELEVEREGFSLRRQFLNARTLISFGLALAIVVFAFRGLNIDVRATFGYMLSANPWYLLLAFGSFYLTFPLRTLRWRLLLHNGGIPIAEGRRSWASLPALMEYIFLSWFANCIVPAKLGDAYRGYLLKHNGRVSFSATFGTIFAERLLDMIGLFSVLALCGLLVFGAQVRAETRLIYGAGVVLVTIIIAGLVAMRWFSPLLRRFMPRRLHRVYGSFEQAALRSFRPAVLPQLIAATGLVWLLEGFRLYFVISALGGLHLALPVIIFVALASSLLTVLPITPAGLGFVEGAVTGVLLLFLPHATGVETATSQNLAAAVALLDRVVNYWSIIVFGFIAYLLSKRK